MRRAYNSTIKVREDRICVSCGKKCVWFSKKRCQQCAKVESCADVPEENEDDLANLIEDADLIFSRYIRNKYAVDGVVACYCCGKEMKVGEAHNGHYISRKHFATRYMEANCRPCCEVCNCHKHGNLAVFGKKLEEEQANITEWLLEQSRSVYKISREELRTIVNDYSAKLKSLNK